MAPLSPFFSTLVLIHSHCESEINIVIVKSLYRKQKIEYANLYCFDIFIIIDANTAVALLYEIIFKTKHMAQSQSQVLSHS